MIFVATTRNTKCRITFAVLQHSTLLLGEHVETLRNYWLCKTASASSGWGGHDEVSMSAASGAHWGTSVPWSIILGGMFERLFCLMESWSLQAPVQSSLVWRLPCLVYTCMYLEPNMDVRIIDTWDDETELRNLFGSLLFDCGRKIYIVNLLLLELRQFGHFSLLGNSFRDSENVQIAKNDLQGHSKSSGMVHFDRSHKFPIRLPL